MALCRSVLKEDNILYKLYADTRSDISDNSDDILDSDSDVPTIRPYKQLQPSAIVVTIDSETSTEEEESSELDSSDNKTSDVLCKNGKNQAMTLSLEPEVWK
jgi:hypothetical protein